MSLSSQFTYFAVTYDCGAYGSDTYSNNKSCETTASTATNSSLTDTGTSIYIGLGIGIILIVSAVIIILRTRNKKNSLAQK